MKDDSPGTVPSDVVEEHQYKLKKKDIRIYPTSRTGDLPWVKIKANVTVRDFVGSFVELKSYSSGAIGLCPFHEDTSPSFGVNEKGNYCYCFAGCGGGSVIDLWMKYKGCDFKTAVVELLTLLELSQFISQWLIRARPV